jgi:formylglycine-generating enzyme required for sulfatase activity
VDYTYGIGKFEVSRDMVNKYNATSGVVAITLADMTNFGGNGVNRPASGISWNEAARFVNWLNTSTGGSAAYKFTTDGRNDDIALWTATDTLDYDATNLYRSKRAKYVLPDYNEWYKAAYYDPNKPGGAGYWEFPTGSDTTPTSVAGGTAQGTGVYNQNSPADVNNAGGLSPYGVMGLGGNLQEWEETSRNLTNNSGSLTRGLRGDFFNGDPSGATKIARNFIGPKNESEDVGFRVAMVGQVPEPSMMVIGTLFGLGGLMAKRRMKK